MPAKRPLIGITPGYSYEEQKIYINNGYIDAVNQAGGLAILLPLTDDEELVSVLVDTCDAFLVSGGPDVDAACYNEYNYTYNGVISPLRDSMELLVIKKAFELGKPMLGICRGIQIINVAMGGTLYQDIASQVKNREVIKHSQQAPVWHPTHDIYIEKDSFVWKSFNEDAIDGDAEEKNAAENDATGNKAAGSNVAGNFVVRVNSFHHQAVKDVAPGFRVTSRAVDGIIESIEYSGEAFIVGVQWHPELMWQKNRVYLKLFDNFIGVAK